MKNENLSLTSELHHLVEQSVWANRQWAEFVYAQPRQDTRPFELLSHIMLGERVWFERVEGTQKTKNTFLELTKDDLLQGFEENKQTYQRLISNQLNHIINFKRASGEAYHASVLNIIYHLITHGYHHRGQLAAHYARGGVTYPSLDHIDFLMANLL